MKLIIDIGNTLTKVGFYQAQSLAEVYSIENITVDYLQSLIKEFQKKTGDFNIKYSILSSVKNYPEEIKEFLNKTSKFFEFNSEIPLPITLKYKTPSTLGNDRIALAVAATGIFPGKNVLIIGAGTCITYDFINEKNEYCGGGISPGIMMRFKALNTFTGKLPLVSNVAPAELIGNSTENSIRSGVLNGAIAEIDGIIGQYTDKFPDLKIILTGGDTNYFDKNLKNNIFANSNMVLAGLNMILDYNVGA